MYELYPEEITMILAKARIAKMSGFAGINCRFNNHQLTAVRVEIDVTKDDLNLIYKNHLTIGTSGISIPA